ncbi:MAG: Dipeptide and tripeptide permease C [Chlamydiales bacterium]|nr:Dipeptide and tripeptide permease C [Chlamydiales bacterium]MCH9635243.1 Dipeptide and tripeptide permease C [Chlamydiales bacterium]
MIGRIFFAQLWKFFSHYGNRALLVLFMVEAMGLSDQKALGIYALYAGLFELGGLAGGVIADRFLGVRRALLLGALLIGAGHLVFAFQGGFFVGLSLIVAGTSLFAPNITALLAEVSEDCDRHFTLFYVVMNIGALLSSVGCPILANRFGWHIGFGAAAVGMLIGVITLLGMPLGESKRPALGLLATAALFVLALLALHNQALILPILPFAVVALFVIALRRVPQVIMPLVALVIFFAVEEQMGSSLMLFIERGVTTSVPTAVLMGINPLVVLLFGTLVAKMKGSKRLVLPFLIVGLAMALLGVAVQRGVNISQFGVMGLFAVISLAELLIGPFVYASVAKVSAKGAVMGLIPLGFSLASLVGGGISKGVSQNFGVGFLAIAVTMLITAVVMRRKSERNRRGNSVGKRVDRCAIKPDDATNLCEQMSETGS